MLFYHSLFLLCKGCDHLLSAALHWKLNQVIRKIKGKSLCTNVTLKLSLTLETNSSSWLPSKYLRRQSLHAAVPPVVSWDAHSTTVLLLQQPLRCQNESKFYLQTNEPRFSLCLQSLHWQQTENNQHHTSSAQEKILGTTSKQKAPRTLLS